MNIPLPRGDGPHRGLHRDLLKLHVQGALRRALKWQRSLPTRTHHLPEGPNESGVFDGGMVIGFGK